MQSSSSGRTKLARVPAGFTLVEVMMVVAIIGLMATIAAPAMKGFAIRAKRAERVVLFPLIRRGFVDYYTAYGRYAGYVSGTQSYLYDYNGYNPRWSGAAQPAAPLITSDPAWSELGITTSGTLRYSYYIQAMADSANSANNYIYISSFADLDNDGAVANHYEYWYMQPDGTFAMTTIYDTPNTD